MAYSPSTNDPTNLRGSVVLLSASGALTLGRAHEITGSAAVTLTVPTPTVNGTLVSVKVNESYTGSGVTLPSGFTSTTLTAGQQNTWQWDGTAWLIQ